ncbi:ring finger protein 32 [Angomonas deanei]|nr:ring finger protein 32 [Angomonas deanei]|eukprot:EPY34352.1 ring finger protein 32 [Angomonas deanei]
MSSDELPSIGVALNKKGTQGTRNNNKVALWSAVALQQHFRKQGACSVVPGMTDEKGAPVAINTSRLPPPQQHGQLTLAQKMGLVPPPPKEPTMEGWQITEQRALLREKLQPLGEQLCGICLEPFYATREEGQVILSCSHVFHEKCFKTFERLTRQRMREEGGDTAIRLACPECRETHYHKKKYFASKALAQRTALVKMQAVVRGFLARRRYTTLRLQSDDTFRGEYAKTRLEKLSRSWERYLSELDKLRESVLLDTDVVKQTAAAAYLSEKDWQAIIRNAPKWTRTT